MARTTNDRIAAIELEIEQLANQKKQLLQKQKSTDRKARTHRICERGGLIESLLPDTIDLTKEDFRLFLEKTVANDFGRRTLANLKAEQDKQTAENGAKTAAQSGDNAADTPTKANQPSNPTPAEKPTGAAQG